MDFLRYLAASDIFFLPAHKDLRFTGIGITTVEALGMGIPVVSPTLINIPDLNVLKDIGIVTPYLETVNDAVKFSKALLYAIENIDMFKPYVGRKIVEKYYSWESFVKDFQEAIKIIKDS